MAKAMRRVLNDLSKHTQLPPKLDQDILNALAEALHTPVGALTPMMDEIEEQFRYAKIETETPDLAAPMAYALEVNNREWHTVKPRYQLAIKELCEHALKLPSGFIDLYTTTVCTEPLEKSPQIPSLYSLEFSTLVQLCEDMRVETPNSGDYSQQRAARIRLQEHPNQYVVSQKMCKLYEDDLKWLTTQEKVLGAGTVVRLHCDRPFENLIKPTIILRPIVRHTYIEGAAILRKLHYVTHLTSIVAATDIAEHIVVAPWPMSKQEFTFVCVGNPDPQSLGWEEAKQRAKELGCETKEMWEQLKRLDDIAAEAYIRQYQGHVMEEWKNALAKMEQENTTPATADTAEQQTAATNKRAGAVEGGAMKLRRLTQDEGVPEEQTAISSLEVQAVGTRPKSKARAPRTLDEVRSD